MKNTINGTILCFILLTAFSFGQIENMENLTIYGGVNSNAIFSEDFQDFHISDWKDYGLGGNEGRVNIALADKDPEGSNLGILVGAKYMLNDRIDSFGEIQVGLGETTMIGLYAGVTYNLINGDKFKLGLTPKIGYTNGIADFGEIELIQGYVAPVIIEEGTFTNGDKLTMDISGLGAQIGVTPSFQLNDKLGLFLQAGYELSFASDPIVKVNEEIELKMDSEAIVKTDGSSTQAGISPAAYMGGTVIQFGITFNLPE